jgi:NTE family protein
MSGAANFGAMQAGALEIVLDQGFQPDLLVGTSAGALNSIYLAEDASPGGVRRLQEKWRLATSEEIGIPKPFVILRRLVTQQDSLVDNQALVQFLRDHLPSGVETFAQLKAVNGMQAYAVAVEMDSGELRVFGDEPTDRLVDGAMASTAVPPYFPPWEADGRRYFDGGVISKLPLLSAVQRGATQIIALDVSYAMGGLEGAKGILGISGYALSIMIETQTATEITMAKQSGVHLRVIELEAPADIEFWDYSQPDRLITVGREAARQAFSEEPLYLMPNWQLKVRRTIAQLRLGDRSA